MQPTSSTEAIAMSDLADQLDALSNLASLIQKRGIDLVEIDIGHPHDHEELRARLTIAAPALDDVDCYDYSDAVVDGETRIDELRDERDRLLERVDELSTELAKKDVDTERPERTATDEVLEAREAVQEADPTTDDADEEATVDEQDGDDVDGEDDSPGDLTGSQLAVYETLADAGEELSSGEILDRVDDYADGTIYSALSTVKDTPYVEYRDDPDSETNGPTYLYRAADVEIDDEPDDTEADPTTDDEEELSFAHDHDPKAQILEAIEENGALPAEDIRLIAQTGSRTAEHLSELVDDGPLIRRVDPEDRRRSIYKFEDDLTPDDVEIALEELVDENTSRVKAKRIAESLGTTSRQVGSRLRKLSARGKVEKTDGYPANWKLVDDTDDTGFDSIDTPDWLDESSFFQAAEMVEDVDELADVLGWDDDREALEELVETLDVDVALDPVVATDGGSKYTVSTGDGYVGIYRVNETGCAIGIGAINQLGWEPGRDLYAISRSDGVLITPDRGGGYLARITVTNNRSGPRVNVSEEALEHLGVGPGDDVRVYEHLAGLLVVTADDDPRVATDGGDAGE